MAHLKNLQDAVLLDLYGGALTPKQRSILDMYLNLDYSLTEIAENENISRQAVSDALRLAQAKLAEWEHMLRMKHRYEATEALLAELERTAASLPQEQAACVAKIIAKLRAVWED